METGDGRPATPAGVSALASSLVFGLRYDPVPPPVAQALQRLQQHELMNIGAPVSLRGPAPRARLGWGTSLATVERWGERAQAILEWRLHRSWQAMEQHRSNPPALEAFWQQADEDASGEHPLEREIADRVDALLRYHTLIADAQAEGRDDLVAILQAQEERQERLLRELRDALRRMEPRGE